MKIKSVLIANRGEIALRVVKTCRRLGIKTVTIYSEDDRSLPHASAGDDCVSLGIGALSETYLNQEKIIDIAKKYGADAIHPGYGFLSENTEFCKKVNDAGVIFIGPSTDAIELMGDKKTSKVAMEKIGIPLIPGYHGDNQEPAFLFEEAKKIGFPVLIKATAGGGGKGMRIVREESEFTSGLEASQREAKNAFGNDKVLIEKYIENPRHIEVQLMSDSHGNHLHFFERECSIQRRYQKVVEETPSPALDDELRKKICETAVKISSGINYLGAGTIEYILAPDNSFYFLEMNTRLQVEHPVTELVTGSDLVEYQIIAAAGEKLPVKQEDIHQKGHALELRIYAEDPDNDFLPSTGKIHFIGSSPIEGVRLDCGYESNNFVNINYDPMLAKLITYDESREENIYKMLGALEDYPFLGLKSNRDYLARILEHDKFIEGDIHTHFIAQYGDDLKKEAFGNNEKALAIACGLIHTKSKKNNAWNYQTNHISRKVLVDGEEHFVNAKFPKADVIQIELLGEKFDFTYLNDSIFLGDELKKFYITQRIPGLDYHLCIGGMEFFVEFPTKAESFGNRALSEGSLQSPMPGKIFKIFKDVGESVNSGDAIMILEAMKMEHTIKAQKDGVIKNIYFKVGEQVQGGVELCEID